MILIDLGYEPLTSKFIILKNHNISLSFVVMPSQNRKHISTVHTCCYEMEIQLSRCSLLSYPDTVSTKRA